MIAAETPRQALTLESNVEHAAQVDSGHGSSMHADAYQATGALIHDHELVSVNRDGTFHVCADAHRQTPRVLPEQITGGRIQSLDLVAVGVTRRARHRDRAACLR